MQGLFFLISQPKHMFWVPKTYVLLLLLLLLLTFFTFSHTRSEIDTYRLLHLRLTAILWNDAFAEHSRYSPNCSSGFLNWDIDREVKFSLCWREALSCSKCQYKSKTYKLYEELQCTKEGLGQLN